MATWQGTNGGLLAGIGGVNSNAPSVNDIGNTLQLIRQNNDIERSGANNVGLTALQGLSGIAGVFQQEKQAQRQKEFQQAYANAYASGDRGALRQLATQYPDQIESVRKGMGFIDEEQRNSIGTLAAGRSNKSRSAVRRALSGISMAAIRRTIFSKQRHLFCWTICSRKPDEASSF